MSGNGLTDGLAIGLCETNLGFYWESGLGGDGLDDPASGVTNGLLLESGSFILLENGGILLLES